VSRRRIRYGGHHSQVADLWLPEADRPPVVVLIHGGFWRAAYTKVLMNNLARAITRRGWAAWNVEYRRVGTLGGGGGWPMTFSDVGAAIEALADVPGIDTSRVVVCGHSAGGQLALWSAARRRCPELSSPGTDEVGLVGVVSLAGVVDLVEADRRGVGGDSVSLLLGGHHDEHPERYRSTSPIELLPLGVRQILIHGLDDDVVPVDLSRSYRAAACQKGESVEFVPVPGGDHRCLIAPAKTGGIVLGAIDRLLD
jgi:acetyl esterase/lipase